MARYFFQLNGEHPYQDNDGVELPDDGAAWSEAKRFARDIEANLQPGDTWRLEVRKESSPLYLLVVSSSRLS